MPESTKHHLKVFLCHAKADKQKVRELYEYLRKRGIKPWLDEKDLVGGQDWQVEIPKAIAMADAIIICLTKNSVDKEGYVQTEIKFALDKALQMPEGRIYLIPVRFEECEVPFSLSRYQWVDLFEQKGFSSLMKSLRTRARQLERATVQVPRPDESKPDLSSTPNQEQSSDISKLTFDPSLVKETIPDSLQRQTEFKNIEKIAKEEQETQKQAADKGVEYAVDEKAAHEKTKGDTLERAGFDETGRDTQKIIEQTGPEESPQLASTKKVEQDRKEKEAVAQSISPSLPIGESEVREEASRNLTEQRKAAPKFNRILIGGIGAIGFIVIGLLFWVGSRLLTNVPIATPESTSTLQSTGTFTPQSLPTNTSFPTKTPVPSTPTLGVGSTVIGKDGMTLLYVPAGEFRMGADVASPIHSVYLDAFWIDQTEVTNRQYAMCVADGKCKTPLETKSKTHFSYYGNPEFDNYPVTYADWDRAKIYCSWVGRRLPTEAEWEKAARGTDRRNFPWGDKFDCTYANFAGLPGDNVCIGDTTEVGSYPSGQSFYGAYDMGGNVWEWVNDYYNVGYYEISPSSNPQGPEKGNLHVIRGGAWNTSAYLMQSAFRERYHSWYTDYNSIGFRCAMSVSP